MRSQYLGYLFALTVGSAAFGAQTIRTHTLSSALDLLLFGFFLLTFAFLAGFVYLCIRKSAVVLTHYESAWNNIRNYFYSSSTVQSQPYSLLNIRSSDHRALRWPWVSLQSSSEFIILFFAALTAISQALLTARLFAISNATLAERIIAIGMITLTVAIPTLLVVALGTSFRKHRQ